MRRGTLVMLIVLFGLLLGAAIWQIRLANEDRGPFPGPTSPGQLPSPSSAEPG